MSKYRLEQAKALAAEFPTVVLIDPQARKYYAWLIEEVERLQAEEAVAWQKGYEQGFQDGHKIAKGEK